jgi:hypothetical protein
MAFSALSIADAYTTMVGLSQGLRETETLAVVLINSFGIQGFILFKVSIALVAAAVAFAFETGMKRRGELAASFYMTASFGLLFITLVPVANNLLLLGWL